MVTLEKTEKYDKKLSRIQLEKDGKVGENWKIFPNKSSWSVYKLYLHDNFADKHGIICVSKGLKQFTYPQLALLRKQ